MTPPPSLNPFPNVQISRRVTDSGGWVSLCLPHPPMRIHLWGKKAKAGSTFRYLASHWPPAVCPGEGARDSEAKRP